MFIARYTKTTYESNQRQFINFCNMTGYDRYTMSEHDLCMAMA
jgi:hypothetical protein